MAALQRMHEQPEQGAHDGAEDQAVAGQHQGGDQWFDPVEQPEDPPDQRADQGAGASTAQRGGAVVHPAEDLFHVLQIAADDGHPVYLETLVGQVVDRAFGVGVVGRSKVAITWRAGSLGRTADVATVECSAITPPIPVGHPHLKPWLLLGCEGRFTEAPTTAEQRRATRVVIRSQTRSLATRSAVACSR